jgi:hypothetical protein
VYDPGHVKRVQEGPPMLAAVGSIPGAGLSLLGEGTASLAPSVKAGPPVCMNSINTDILLPS